MEDLILLLIMSLAFLLGNAYIEKLDVYLDSLRVIWKEERNNEE